MAILIFLTIFFITFYAINRFSIDSAISASFIGRASLIFLFLCMGIFHIREALFMNDMSENASEKIRNLTFFAGVFEVVFSVGLTFVYSLKWTSLALIGFLILLIFLNIFGVLRDFQFAQFGKTVNYPLNVVEYLAIGGWAIIFGIVYRDKEGIFGLKGKGW